MIMDVLVSHLVLCSSIDTSALPFGTNYYNSYATEKNQCNTKMGNGAVVVNNMLFFSELTINLNHLKSCDACVTAAAIGTKYAGKVTASNLLSTCYSLAALDTCIMHD